MHIVELFYAEGDRQSREAKRIFSEVVEESDDVMLIGHDIESDPGIRKASAMDVYEVPTAIIDRERAMVGVPHSKEQVLRSLR
ncbi:MAG: hypothetical protein SV186_07075 [Candidatus Nanohaloarchaea archaeon]|nr:hypothetical protein [Candidatus Nanohaloarchaea archaeon]